MANVEIEENDYKIYECPVCLEYFQKPIRQCIKGHSFCEGCLNQLQNKICPECRSQVTDTRNYKLEELLEKASLPCIYKSTGCPFILNIKEMSEHVLECKHRLLKCEGKKFCNWKCEWLGHDIKKHFEETHKEYSKMEFTGDFDKKFIETKDYYDLHLISAHYQLFWFKQKIDIKRQKVFWAFQFIGPKKNANYYYYEFEIYNKEIPMKKFKITEYCMSDIENIDNIFDTEKCVAISFKMLKNYLDDSNMYSYRFRLMKIPNPEKQKAKPSQGTKQKAPVLPPQNSILPLLSLPTPIFQYHHLSTQNIPKEIVRNPKSKEKKYYRKK